MRRIAAHGGGDGDGAVGMAEAAGGAYRALAGVSLEAAGDHCAYGGKKVSAGLDADGDLLLDAGEVTSTDYVCHGAAGAGGLAWLNVTGASQTMASNTGYVASSASQVTLTLPASPNIGELFAVTGAGFGGWKIAQNNGQFVTARDLSNDLSAGGVWRTSGTNGNWTAAASSQTGWPWPRRTMAAGSSRW